MCVWRESCVAPVWLQGSYHDPPDTGLQSELLDGPLGDDDVAAGAARGHGDALKNTFLAY